MLHIALQRIYRRTRERTGIWKVTVALSVGVLGHLAEYAPPENYDEKYTKWQFDDLPIIPDIWQVQVSEDKKKQFEILCRLMNREDVAYLVNGCDAGREGELIFKRVYDLARCQKPVKRLWISSMELLV